MTDPDRVPWIMVPAGAVEGEGAGGAGQRACAGGGDEVDVERDSFEPGTDSSDRPLRFL